MNSAIRSPNPAASSAGVPPRAVSATARDARSRTKASTAARSPSLERKWCCTRPGDTPAAAATPRIVVATIPTLAKLTRAARRIRA